MEPNKCKCGNIPDVFESSERYERHGGGYLYTTVVCLKCSNYGPHKSTKFDGDIDDVGDLRGYQNIKAILAWNENIT